MGRVIKMYLESEHVGDGDFQAMAGMARVFAFLPQIHGSVENRALLGCPRKLVNG